MPSNPAQYIKWSNFFALGLACAYYLACAPARFDRDAQRACPAFTERCDPRPDGNYFDYTVAMNGDKVDILIVDDNSPSMSFEQRTVANRFNFFINMLESKNVDYQIAVTTTDISSPNNPARAINRNGELQDGKLIPFSNGSPILTRSWGTQAERVTSFANVIQRQETLDCETFLKTTTPSQSASYISQYREHCPSGDERGIYSAYLSISNFSSQFIRPDSKKLVIVFLSDEDVRSSNYFSDPSYSLSPEDLPQNLKQAITNQWPEKSFVAHSIIVKPGVYKTGISSSAGEVSSFGTTSNPTTLFGNPSAESVSCLNEQNSQLPNVKGSYGYIYAMMTRMTAGVEGNICSDQYNHPLDQIGEAIVEKSLALACVSPENLKVELLPSHGVLPFHVENQRIVFDQDPPTSTTGFHLIYKCPLE